MLVKASYVALLRDPFFNQPITAHKLSSVADHDDERLFITDNTAKPVITASENSTPVIKAPSRVIEDCLNRNSVVTIHSTTSLHDIDRFPAEHGIMQIADNIEYSILRSSTQTNCSTSIFSEENNSASTVQKPSFLIRQQDSSQLFIVNDDIQSGLSNDTISEVNTEEEGSTITDYRRKEDYYSQIIKCHHQFLKKQQYQPKCEDERNNAFHVASSHRHHSLRRVTGKTVAGINLINSSLISKDGGIYSSNGMPVFKPLPTFINDTSTTAVVFTKRRKTILTRVKTLVTKKKK